MSPNVDAAAIASASSIDQLAAADDMQDSHEHEPRLLEHAYDGIQEYDNPLPGWWRAIFWASIVFSAGYLVYFHVGGWGTQPAERYQAMLAAYDDLRSRHDPTAGIDDDVLARRAAEPAALDRGAVVFTNRCASCHAPNGAGLIGPNLTDLFQLHGDSRLDIYKTIVVGVPGTAMLGWREQLSRDELLDVAAYATALRGQNLPGKPAQGAPIAASGK